MKAQTYSCAMENASSNKSCNTNHHNKELTDAEFDACKGLCQHDQCKAWYGDKAKLVPVEGTVRELPDDDPKVGQVWNHHKCPDDRAVLINAVSKDRSLVFVTGTDDYYTPTGIISVDHLHRRYILDTNW